MGRSPPVPNPSTASLPLCAVSQKASQGMGTVRWIEKALCPFTALGCLAREHTRPETGLLPVDWGPVNPPAASTVRDVPAKDVRTPMPVQGAPAPHPPPCPTHHADSHTPQKVRPLLPFLKPLGAPSVFDHHFWSGRQQEVLSKALPLPDVCRWPRVATPKGTPRRSPVSAPPC